MFWRFGGYANISTIDTILEKPDFRLEDLLEESDLIQELKQHNAKLVEYLRELTVLEKLLDYVVAPKLAPVATTDEDDEDIDGNGKARENAFQRPRSSSRVTDTENEEEEGEKKRNRYAYVAAEILSSDNWSIHETLLENKELLRNFWQFLKRPVPLDPLQASYFTKVNESLFDKKTEEMLDLLKSLDDPVSDMLRHVDCPMIMDLLLKIISLERTDSGQGIVEWLYTQQVMPTLLSFLGPEHSWATQTSAGDFMKAIITVSANASQNEQTCIGPNELTRQLVSNPCVEQLIGYMLGGGNPLTVGVGIVIEVIRKNNSDYDPDVGAESNSAPSSRDPIYLGTLLRLFAQHVPDFMHLVMNAPAQKERLNSTFGEKIEPLGFDRFKTCELMAELLHCSNMALLNEVGAEEVIATRDIDRQRLRLEGRLSRIRSEEIPAASQDDLTMRKPEPTAPEEGRKLEVTNVSADDDGFEEVTHTGDLGEDTSHEFVKAEGELTPTGPKPPSPFLGKDEDDDFVDEPLSSPRLNILQENLNESHFEEPELLVAPLSPTKSPIKSKPDGNDAGKEVEEPIQVKTSEEPAQKKERVKSPVLSLQVPEAKAPAESDLSPDDKGDEDMDTPIATPTTTSDPESVQFPEPTAEPAKPVESSTPEDPAPPAQLQQGLSPHAEDTPAPLFSRRQEPEEPTQRETSPTKAEEEEKPMSASHIFEESPTTGTPGVEPGDASVIIGQAADTITEDGTSIEDEEVTPVVGDYLKQQFVEYRVVPTILQFFFTYPWNNFLHNVVYDIVQQVFNGPMDRGFNPTLAISLFEAADITNQIIQGQLASEQSQERNKTRMGYMGHLTLIAEEVVKFTERHPPELLSETVLDRVMSPDWINYVEGALAETRERDNAVLGGERPELAMKSMNMNMGGGAGAGGLAGLSSALGSLTGAQNASQALAEAGLNGGVGMSNEEGGSNGAVGPFAISAGTLMSGFGSSSDEEDEEEVEQEVEQDTEEDVNNEFRAYTDPLNANSIAPPSIPPPPPPPPLNVPVSRARLQFAARLAASKRNAQAQNASASTSNTQNGGGSSSAEASDSSSNIGNSSGDSSAPGFAILKSLQSGGDSPERLRNPFADDEDEEEEDLEREGSGGSDDGNNLTGEASGSGGDWTRGNWWRGVVRGVSKSGPSSGGPAKHSRGWGSMGVKERFGDGRDDSDSSGDEDAVGLGLGRRRDEEGDEDDEEFGDFAMPEVGEGRTAGSGDIGNGVEGTGSGHSQPAGSISGIDPAREKVLLKPLPVHPASSGKSASAFGSIWPWSAQPSSGGSSTSNPSSAANAGTTTTPASNTQSMAPEEDEEGELVLAEDGSRVSRTVEAKRRTSIEDPDDDEEDAPLSGPNVERGRGKETLPLRTQASSQVSAGADKSADAGAKEVRETAADDSVD